jgi:hypothetical protein
MGAEFGCFRAARSTVAGLDGADRGDAGVVIAANTDAARCCVDCFGIFSWMAFAGMFKDDPWVDDWKRSIEEYRKQVDEDPDAL